jgi:hypothetical protein
MRNLLRSMGMCIGILNRSAGKRQKMKTKIGPISSYSRDMERVTIIDPPYTVFGSSVLMPSFTITMNVKGLKEMLSLAGEDDAFQITVHHEKMTEYSIIRDKTAPQNSGTVKNVQTTASCGSGQNPKISEVSTSA